MGQVPRRLIEDDGYRPEGGGTSQRGNGAGHESLIRHLPCFGRNFKQKFAESHKVVTILQARADSSRLDTGHECQRTAPAS